MFIELRISDERHAKLRFTTVPTFDTKNRSLWTIRICPQSNVTWREWLDSRSILDPLRFSRGDVTVTYFASNSRLPNVFVRTVVECTIRNGFFEEITHVFCYKLCYFDVLKLSIACWLFVSFVFHWFEYLPTRHFKRYANEFSTTNYHIIIQIIIIFLVAVKGIFWTQKR